MPIYEYEKTSDSFCAHCVDGFELLQKISDAALTACPECGSPVHRKISAPNLGNSGPSLDPSNLDKKGFTQYRKSGKGVYEKTAGKGPDIIKDD